MVGAISFDLFDTVVDLRMEDLPVFHAEGRQQRGTHAELHALVSAVTPINLDPFLEALRETDREHGEPLLSAMREYPTIERFGHLLERLGVANATLARKLTEHHMGLISAQAHFLPHHETILRRLAERAPLAICSNFSHTETAERVLDESKLRPHLRATAISEEVGIRKPRREIFEMTLERLGTRAAETLHVGDRLDADVAGAAEAGMTSVWITRRVEDPQAALRDHDGPTPDHVISDLSGLLPLVGLDP